MPAYVFRIIVQIFELFLLMALQCGAGAGLRWITRRGEVFGYFYSCPPLFTSNLLQIHIIHSQRQLEMCIEIRNTGKVLLRILCNYMPLNIWKRGSWECGHLSIFRPLTEQANNKSEWFHLKCTQSQSKLYCLLVIWI